jgi:hypothetical protein
MTTAERFASVICDKLASSEDTIAMGFMEANNLLPRDCEIIQQQEGFGRITKRILCIKTGESVLLSSFSIGDYIGGI